jgi:hypothetical protein
MGNPPGNQPGGEDPELRRWAAGLGDAGERRRVRGFVSERERGECAERERETIRKLQLIRWR